MATSPSPHPHPGPPPPIQSSTPLTAGFAHDRFTIGGGVAIFHVASSRVVVCHHSRDKYYFLPKGRRDVHETTQQGAEREGFEESGYRNRLLPIPLRHRQPQPRIPTDPRFSSFSTEPVYAQLYPQTAHSQYLCFWYISETLPPSIEAQLNQADEDAEGESMFGAPYQYPPPYGMEMTLRERVALEPKGWVPVRHENTGADAEEALYESELVSVEVALERLRDIPVMQFVVRVGWEAILQRMAMEGS